jgi:DNA polymerase-3 subunit delta
MLSIYYGEDDYTPEETIRAVRQDLGDPTVADLNVTMLDGARVTIDEVVQAVQAAPFLAATRLVVIRGLLSRLGGGRRGTDAEDETDGSPTGNRTKASWQAWIKPLTELPPTTHLILWEIGSLAGNPLFKALAAMPGAAVQAFTPPVGRELMAWIAARGRQRQANLSPAAVRRLADLLGNDLRRLDAEIEKLAVFAAGTPIDERLVDQIVTADREAAVWDLTDPLIARRGDQAMRALHSLLAAGWAPAQILFAIAGQLRRLLLAQALLDRRATREEIRRVCNVRSDFALQKVIEQARAYRPADLERAYHALLHADVQSKTGRLDATLALELLVQDLCAARPRPAIRR